MPKSPLNATMTGEQLDAALAALGFNQSSFARGIGSVPRTVRSWVLGEYAVPTHIATLVRLMQRAKVKPAELPEVAR
jgi:DNA-binding transcriptional regulator YiaG